VTGPTAAGRLTEPTDLPRCAGDAGVAAVLILALASVLTLVGAGSASLAAVAVARQRAAAVADLSALAAAERALSGQTAACGRAARVAEQAAARLLSCTLTGDIADVVAQVRPPGPLGRLGAAAARARAGPGNLPADPSVGPPTDHA
jgi:secretion/DNA translocation related TadE-like protein